MTNNNSSSSKRTSYRQQKLKSKQIDNQLYGNSSSQIVLSNNQQVQNSSTRPLRILLMGPRNCGIKTFLMNALDMEADDFMIRSMLTVSQRVNQLSNNNLAGIDDTNVVTTQLTFQQKVESIFSEKSRNITLNVLMYICRGIKVFVKWERNYFQTRKKIHENHEKHHYHEEHFDLLYNWEEDADGKLLDELINDCREKNRLNSKIVSLYSKIVNYGKKEIITEFYSSLFKLTNVRYLDNIQYFFTLDAFNRVTSNDYKPLNQDILKSHHSDDKGIISIRRDGFEFIDITGQLNERRKWIHQFSNSIDFIMFFIPISDYNLINPLSGMNRLVESIHLFNEIQRTKHFKGIDISIMLTKLDLFKKKLVLDPISNHFEKFHDSNGNLKQTMETMRGIFSENFEQDSNLVNRRLFVHQLDLTDVNEFKIVYRSMSSTLRMGTFFSIFANKR